MELKNLLYEVLDNIATITINRPDKLNALNHDTLSELNLVIEKIKSDESWKLWTCQNPKEEE